MERRTLSQLLEVDKPAWPLVTQWVSEAKTTAELLLPPDAGEGELEALQATTRSPMGAVAYNSGGLLLDGGWLKVLGGSHPRLPLTIFGVTRELGFWPDPDAPPTALVVAVDILGGVFAIDGDMLGAPGNVHYLAPDDPEWMDCETGYTDWLRGILGDGFADFYTELRWPGWEEELAKLEPTQGISIYPPPWSEEGSEIAKATRKPVPLTELVGLLLETAARLGSDD